MLNDKYTEKNGIKNKFLTSNSLIPPLFFFHLSYLPLPTHLSSPQFPNFPTNTLTPPLLQTINTTSLLFPYRPSSSCSSHSFLSLIQPAQPLDSFLPQTAPSATYHLWSAPKPNHHSSGSWFDLHLLFQNENKASQNGFLVWEEIEIK